MLSLSSASCANIHVHREVVGRNAPRHSKRGVMSRIGQKVVNNEGFRTLLVTFC